MSAELATSGPFPGVVEPGMRLGSYEVLLCIARGGMASVWAARQHGARGFNRLVALKTVLPELAEPEFESMFLDEARVASRIHHPNVCEIFELVEHAGVLALSMEWVDGDTLNTVINNREQEPLDARVAAHIVAQVACGLHAAHELRDESGAMMQLVHRDVSPQNILISRAGHVKVADFGVAKALGGSREETAVGRVKGKLGYMSPEQAEGRSLDRRSDIFSLGVVLYLATVGIHPYRRPGDAREQQLLRLLIGDFERPSAVIAGYPPELEAIVLCAMSRDPDERFDTADDMRRKLQEWLQRSGPLVSEHDISRAVIDRVGKSIQERTERIQRVLRARPKIALATDVTVSELTLVPTISAVAVASAVRSVLRLRLARAASFGAAAAATILAAAWLFGGRPGEPAAAVASAPSVLVQVGPASIGVDAPAAPASLPTASERAAAAPNVRSPAPASPRESGRDTPRRKPVAVQSSRPAAAAAASTRTEASSSEAARASKPARTAEPRPAPAATRSPVRAAPPARTAPRTVRPARIGPLESDL